MHEPFAGEPGNVGCFQVPEDELARTILHAHAAGWQIATTPSGTGRSPWCWTHTRRRWYMVRRRTASGELLGTAERLTPEQALRAYTYGS
jgi:predicted amidohydrolase YtcJ